MAPWLRPSRLGRTVAVVSIPVLLGAAQSLALGGSAPRVPLELRSAPAALPPTVAPDSVPRLLGPVLEVALINVDRAQAGRPALREDPSLDRVAQFRAQDMLARHYFSHVDPTTGTLAVLEAFASFDVPYRSAGENIAWSTSLSAELFNSWFMDSPDHRDNLLSLAFHQVGVGLAQAQGRTVIAEVFTD